LILYEKRSFAGSVANFGRVVRADSISQAAMGDPNAQSQISRQIGELEAPAWHMPDESKDCNVLCSSDILLLAHGCPEKTQPPLRHHHQ